jgi:intraflagellar transport protein 56
MFTTFIPSQYFNVAEDDDFNWNYGLSLAASGDYKRAEETLLQVRDEAYKDEFVYIRWLARCFIMNDKPEKAWSLYTHLKLHGHDTLLLELIATDCYRKGYFLIAARAFDEFHTDADEKSNFPAIEGVRGACIGVLKQFIINKNDGKHGFPKQLEQMMAILEKYKNYQNLKMTIKKIESLLSTISAE